MKFGQFLQRSLHSEWAGYYLAYKSLKRIIKSAIVDGNAIGNPRAAGMLMHDLHENLKIYY